MIKTEACELLAETSRAIAVRLKKTPKRPVGGAPRLVVAYCAPNVTPRLLAMELRKLAEQLINAKDDLVADSTEA